MLLSVEERDGFDPSWALVDTFSSQRRGRLSRD